MKKLIPHVYMSKDDFPPSLSPHLVLENMFEFFESWKSKLYDMISFNSLPPSVPRPARPPSISIKEEPVEEEPSLLSSSVPRHHPAPRYSCYGGTALLEETKEILAQADSSCSRSESPTPALSPVTQGRKKKRDRSRSSSGGKESRSKAPMKSFKAEEDRFPSSEEAVKRRRAGRHLSKGNIISMFSVFLCFLVSFRWESLLNFERKRMIFPPSSV